MAKLYGSNDAVDFAAANLVSFGGSFTRLNGQPIDKSSIWYAAYVDIDDNWKVVDSAHEKAVYKTGLERATNYAASNAAYVGQILAVVNEDKTSLYVISTEAGTLQPLTVRDIEIFRELFNEQAHDKVLMWDNSQQAMVAKEIKYEPTDGSDAGILSFFE
jgi:hypothetical protein